MNNKPDNEIDSVVDELNAGIHRCVVCDANIYDHARLRTAVERGVAVARERLKKKLDHYEAGIEEGYIDPSDTNALGDFIDHLRRTVLGGE